MHVVGHNQDKCLTDRIYNATSVYVHQQIMLECKHKIIETAFISPILTKQTKREERRVFSRAIGNALAPVAPQAVASLECPFWRLHIVTHQLHVVHLSPRLLLTRAIGLTETES